MDVNPNFIDKVERFGMEVYWNVLSGQSGSHDAFREFGQVASDVDFHVNSLLSDCKKGFERTGDDDLMEIFVSCENVKKYHAMLEMGPHSELGGPTVKLMGLSLFVLIQRFYAGYYQGSLPITLGMLAKAGSLFGNKAASAKSEMMHSLLQATGRDSLPAPQPKGNADEYIQTKCLGVVSFGGMNNGRPAGPAGEIGIDY